MSSSAHCIVHFLFLRKIIPQFPPREMKLEMISCPLSTTFINFLRGYKCIGFLIWTFWSRTYKKYLSPFLIKEPIANIDIYLTLQNLFTMFLCYAEMSVGASELICMETLNSGSSTWATLCVTIKLHF